MPIVFRCLQCQKTLRVGDDAAGKKARCPDCGTIQDVPAAGFDVPFGPVATSPGPPATARRDDDPFKTSAGANVNPFGDVAQPITGSADTANPYASPLQPGGLTSQYSYLTFAQRRQIAENKVKGPALAMMVFQVIVLIMVLFQLVTFWFQGNFDRVEAIFPMVSIGMSLGMSFIILFGAWQMYRLKGYPWAMAASILSMIPCTGCCILGMPVGIWALVVLNDSLVKSAFD